ncbi:MAG: hypothetical protein ACI9E1_001936 [Cryomorphaceae bacterium]|jgi:hypothetical protein
MQSLSILLRSSIMAQIKITLNFEAIQKKMQLLILKYPADANLDIKPIISTQQNPYS